MALFIAGLLMSISIDLDEQIIHHLNSLVHPIDLRALSSSLRRRVDAPDYIVVRHLRKLVQQGAAECLNGAWRSTERQLGDS